MKTLNHVLRLILDTYNEWSQDNAARLGAALAYYALFSIAPLLILIITIVGTVYGEAATRGEIVNTIAGQIGQEAAQGVEQLLASVHNSSSSSLFTTVLSAILLIFGATSLFGQLKESLNLLWKIHPRKSKNIFSGILDIARDRLVAIVMVVAFSVILLAELALSAILTALNGWLRTILPPSFFFLLEGANLIIIFGVTALLFALTFKLLPDAKISWRVVWVGALVTSFLFNLGIILIGLYLGHYGTQSALGAAGSLVVIMVWIYYSAQIFFFGAKFARVYAAAIGKPILPASRADSVN